YILGTGGLALDFYGWSPGNTFSMKPPNIFLAVSLCIISLGIAWGQLIHIAGHPGAKRIIPAVFIEKAPLIQLFWTLLLWIAFLSLYLRGDHLMVKDITDFHGSSVGESYLVSAYLSIGLFFLSIPVLFLSIPGTIRYFSGKTLKADGYYLITFLASLLWMGFYFWVCRSEPYFY
ncbi:MAG: hypothetical protein OEZ36_07800, partial [Spirochaetota bacterium]|nr:hypothetical protein [Spirochaetota bacterium]